jgi:membrane-associated protease RseP (regulator of RpoE activity)
LEQSPNPNHSNSVNPADPRALPESVASSEPAPPLTPMAWLTNNGPYLVVLAAIIGVVWYKFGPEGVWYGALVVFGLGFVIFIHELGHFLTAKWCDVHVQTFSIGFGPALPGCSFQRGETVYKIGVLPLGGYVNMVGEGFETDEDENYPRSFKNKTVGQRMLIISAGVIMNVILGCILFIVVYAYHGVERAPGIIGIVDAGGPLWEKGVPSGAVITELGGIRHPVFEDLRIKVILSSAGEQIPFTFDIYGENGQATERQVNLTPRREENDLNPVIGVVPPRQLKLFPRPKKEMDIAPVIKNTAAAAARPLPLGPDEFLVGTTDPDHPETFKELAHDRKAGTFDFEELSQRLRRLAGQKMVVQVLSKDAEAGAKPDEREVPVEGFQFDDTIVGCTRAQDPRSKSYNPFLVSELPRDPRHKEGDRRDPFIFHARLKELAGVPMVVEVLRKEATAGSERVNLFVPSAYHLSFGMRMKMGKVAALREDSPASRAGVQKGDELIKVTMKQGEETLLQLEDLDPERLPYQLTRAASSKPGEKKVELVVRRDSETEHGSKDVRLPPVDWEERWRDDEEVPYSAASPLPLPQLGLAYWVLSQVVEVKADSPAAAAGLKKDTLLTRVRYKEPGSRGKEPDWSAWMDLKSQRSGKPDAYDRWAQTFWGMQLSEYRDIQVEVSGRDAKDPVTLAAREDETWPLASRGIRLMPDYSVQKADNFGEALVLGSRRTGQLIVVMYLQLRSLFTGRVSFKQVGGPVEMLRQGFSVAENGYWELLLFLGVISINLAVVNFLPIPVLDGGHMVFLVYEKLRGRAPPENVRIVATYIGLALIGLIMILAFYQDIRKLFGS